MAGPEDVDDELEGEITDEATKYGIVERVVIYQERQSEKPGDVIIKIFILFQSADRTTPSTHPPTHPPTHRRQLMVVLCWLWGTTEAQKALTSLNGRWFGGRQIKAAFYDEKKFLAEDYSED
jgi:poly(U)-binding-splicing factor PUF60